MAPPAEADALSEVIFLMDRIFEGTGPLLGVIKEIKLGPEAKRGGPWLLRWARVEEIDLVSYSLMWLLSLDIGKPVWFGERVFVLDVGFKVRVLQDLIHLNKIIISSPFTIISLSARIFYFNFPNRCLVCSWLNL